MIRNIRDYWVIKKNRSFDPIYYLSNYPDVRRADVDPLWHFVTSGWKEGRNPSDKFNCQYYLHTYVDVEKANINPLIHFIKYGKKEGRISLPYFRVQLSLLNQKNKKQTRNLDNKRALLVIKKFNKLTSEFGIFFALKRAVKKIFRVNLSKQKDYVSPFANALPVKNGFIFITHDLSKTGAPINLLNLCKTYKKEYGNNFIVISIANGPLYKEYKKVGNIICLDYPIPHFEINENVEELFYKLYNLGYTNCIANTTISGVFAPLLAKIGIQSIYLIHELPQAINHNGWGNYASNIAKSNSKVVFAAEYVSKKFKESFKLPDNLVRIFPQGIKSSSVYRFDKSNAKKKLMQILKIKPQEGIKVVVGVGYANYVKGTDIFFEVARELFLTNRLNRIHFLWVGGRDDDIEKWKRNIAPNLPFSSNIHFLDFQEDISYIYAGSDLFLLTSREDSYPSVALEALANNLPVIVFKDTGGIEEIINDSNGKVIPAFNIEAFSNAVIDLLRFSRVESNSRTSISTYKEYLDNLLGIFKDDKENFVDAHKVSVIIPNYNYGRFLEVRIRSILNQTYAPSEIIFLDDNSSDNSIQLAKKILSGSPIPYKIITNDNNHGVFPQWIKGIKESSYDYVWIAEADDFASPDFLLEMMNGFRKDERVSLCYCQSIQVDESSVPNKEYKYNDYVKDLSTTKWLSDYIENGFFEVSNYLSIRNTIPNASAVVIKKSSIGGLDDQLLRYKYVGDWFTYIYSLKKGKIFYSSKKLNMYRRHSKSVISLCGGSKEFFEEIKSVQSYVTENFNINSSILKRMEASTNSENQANAFDLDSFYDTLNAHVLKKLRNKELTILIVVAEFKMGGGEMIGVRLANYLAKAHTLYLYPVRKGFSEEFIKNISPNVVILKDDESAFELIHSGVVDIVNSHVWWSDKFTYSLLKDNNVFWILSMHGCYEMLMNNPYVDTEFSRLSELILKRANSIIYDAKKNLRLFNQNGLENLLPKTTLLYNGFPYEKKDITFSRNDINISDKSFVFILIARGIKEKGWEEAIQAIKLLHDAEGYCVDLILIGDSEYVEGLREKNKDYAYIHFLGEKQNTYDYLHISDCGLLPTYFVSESQPLIIAEYMANGLPVIATDVGEIKNMLSTDKYCAGLTIPLKGEKIKLSDLLELMKEMINDSEKFNEYKRSAVKIFDFKFDFRKFADSYLSIYFRGFERNK